MAIIKCPNCGEEVSDKAKKCIHCGVDLIKEPVQTKFCGDCGHENPIDAKECSHCGCPFEEQTDGMEQTDLKSLSNKKKKRKLPIILLCILSIIAIIFFATIISYNISLKLLDKGEYNKADTLLKIIRYYKDVPKIREEVKYESLAYSAITATKDALKNPDSLIIHDIKFYSSSHKNENTTSNDTDTNNSEESDTIINEKYPFIILKIGGQNGFGGTATGYIGCSYSKSKCGYDIGCSTNTLKEDELNKNDDDYVSDFLSTKIIKQYINDGNEVGSINLNRIKNIVKNNSYLNIKIIQ